MAQPFKSKTGIYQLRRKVPAELRKALGHEYKRSLKTRDPVTAKSNFAVEWAASEEAFALARAQLSGGDSLGERDIQQLAARWFRAEFGKLETTGDFKPWLVEGETLAVEQGDHYEEHTPWISVREAMTEEPEVDFSAEIESNVKKTLRGDGIPMPTDAATRERLIGVFREHWLKLSDLALERYKGKRPSRAFHWFSALSVGRRALPMAL